MSAAGNMAATRTSLLLLHCLLALLNSVTGDLLQRVEVPSFAFAGGRVNVSCMFDLRATGLYSLKWYHNDTEFYRYVPTETHRQVDIKPTMKFQAHVSTATPVSVYLWRGSWGLEFGLLNSFKAFSIDAEGVSRRLIFNCQEECSISSRTVTGTTSRNISRIGNRGSR
nr:uncharacterized protein LOC123759497 [Procambarus clarkii]